MRTGRPLRSADRRRCSSPMAVTGTSSMVRIRSSGRMPARAAGLPATTEVTSRPADRPVPRAARGGRGRLPPPIPSQARRTRRPAISEPMIPRVTVLTGTASPRPCPIPGPTTAVLIPTTAAVLSARAPPEEPGAMGASVAFHLFNQVERGENPKLFGAYDGFGPGEQSRDFIHVGDVADVNLWLWKRG